MRNSNSSPKSGDSRGANKKRDTNASSGKSTSTGGPRKGTSFSENRKNVAQKKKNPSFDGEFDAPKGGSSSFAKKKFSNNERGFKGKPEESKSFGKFKSDSKEKSFKPKSFKDDGMGDNSFKSKSFKEDDFKSKSFRSKSFKNEDNRGTSFKPKSFKDEEFKEKSFSSSAPRDGGFKRKPLKKAVSFDDNFESKKTARKDSVLAESGIRLNKFISNSGICSRREADLFIEQGVVKVNGTVVTELGYRVQPGDDVQFDGKHIRPEKPVYLLLNKPKDYLTSMSDDRGRKTVMNLIKDACKERVFPVGRLDRNTMGLLLFTNDGELADKLMHPRKSVKKIYMAELSKNLKEEHIDALRNGVVLEDGFFKPDVVEYVAEKGKIEKSKIGIEIHSGRNRIVRRLFEHFGYQVVKLDRVMYGGLTKKNLLRGKWRLLNEREIAQLKMM